MNQQTESNITTRSESVSGEAPARTLSRYQGYLLETLRRMRRNRQEYAFRPDAEAWVLKAMDRAIYSVYLDCLDQGIGQEAGSLLSGGEGDLPQHPEASGRN